MFRRAKQSDRVHNNNLIPVSKGPLALGLSYVIGPDGSQLFGTVTTPIETGAFLPVAIGGGLARSNQGAAWWNATENVAKILAPTNTAFTIVFTIQLNALGQTNKYIAQIKDASTNQFAVIYGYVSGTFEIYAVGNTGVDPRTGSQIVVNDLAVHTVGYSYDGVTLTGALDGKIVFSVAKTFNLNFTANAGTLYSAISGGNLLSTKIQLWSTHDRGLNLEELSELTKNHEKIFQVIPAEIPIAAAAAAFSGNANSVTTATGAISINVPVSGLSASLTSANGSITQNVPLTANAQSIASATASILINTPLNGAAQSVAAATGSVSIQVFLSTAALAQSTMQGALTLDGALSGIAASIAAATGQIGQNIFVSGAAQSVASATGQIGINAQISGAALAQALATGQITSGAQISGASNSVATATGAVSINIPLVGSAVATANMIGGIGLIIPISGVAASIAAATGALTLSGAISVTGLAQAISSGAGSIILNIPISGAALAQASASAAILGAAKISSIVLRMYNRSVTLTLAGTV